mgnify:CR=1 FL=1
MKTLDDIQFKGKRVLMRVDFNVPLDKERHVKDDLRIRAVLPSIRKVLDSGGRLILASHLGRPKGKVVEEFSLRPAADYLAKLLGKNVPLAESPPVADLCFTSVSIGALVALAFCTSRKAIAPPHSSSRGL